MARLEGGRTSASIGSAISRQNFKRNRENRLKEKDKIRVKTDEGIQGLAKDSKGEESMII